MRKTKRNNVKDRRKRKHYFSSEAFERRDLLRWSLVMFCFDRVVVLTLRERLDLWVGDCPFPKGLGILEMGD